MGPRNGTLYATLSQKYTSILNAAQMHYGGTVYSSNPSHTPQWQVGGGACALDFVQCMHMLPHSVEKLPQLEVVNSMHDKSNEDVILRLRQYKGRQTL